MSNTQDTRADRKRRYEKILRTVKENTSPKQPPGVPAGSLWQILVDNNGMDADAAQSHVRAAVENDDLFKYTDRDGVVRYARADKSLRRLIGQENERDHPDVTLIERAAEAIGGGERGD